MKFRQSLQRCSGINRKRNDDVRNELNIVKLDDKMEYNKKYVKGTRRMDEKYQN